MAVCVPKAHHFTSLNLSNRRVKATSQNFITRKCYKADERVYKEIWFEIVLVKYFFLPCLFVCFAFAFISPWEPQLLSHQA